MNRLAKPAASKLDLELCALAVSAVNGCENCVGAHERVLIGGRLTEAQIHDAVRLAAVMNAAALSLELGQEVALDEGPQQAAG